MLIAVAGGLGGAICFAVAALCASSSSREIGAASTLAWVMALGLGILVVPIALVGNPSRLSGDTVALLCTAGLSNVIGLHLEYVAFRRVAVGIVVAVASTEGMVAAVLSSVFGTPLAASTVVLLVVITIGVVLAAAHLDPPGDGSAGSQVQQGPRSSAIDVMKRLDGSRTRSALLVVPVALLFGITLYATGRAGTEAPIIWALLPARLFGTLLITSPLLVRRKLRISRRTFPLVLSGGVAEVVGLVSYTFGARHELAVAAVLASQCAAITTVAAFFLFGERLRRHQVLGIATVVVGVVTLSALRG
ncbi:MAG: EamA family transporter [Acidimicrobiales bacterium]